ncbi:cation transporter [Magnetospirillum moscoviense]|uniref:Cation efflux protein transmembrane domain-containing protein n=1 Tax=Magnetospirillum moscoviense TaxID=1437059 RepID=A0A178MZ37_9PROT|nr:cation transporter [Magnetospirillum moscoviense]OAN66052.1 hypothetical protein A6A05_18535 [Magnetospirillum moscoviense]
MGKATAEKGNVALCSMDDESLYGKELHVITFSEAVQAKLLVDYKVVVLAMDEAHVSRTLQNLLKDDDKQIKVEDAAKIVGCWKALSKQDTREALVDDHSPMRRAVAFCQVIEMQNGGKTHKVSSKKIDQMFARVVEEYKANNTDDSGTAATLRCETSHIDGGMDMFVALALAVCKTILGVMSGSMALQAHSLHSLGDFLTKGINLASAKLSSRQVGTDLGARRVGLVPMRSMVGRVA